MENTNENNNRRKIITAYQYMERLPGQWERILSSYSEKVKAEKERHEKQVHDSEKAFKAKKNRIEADKQNAYEEADSAKETIFGQLEELKAQALKGSEAYTEVLNSLPRTGKKGTYAIGKGLINVLGHIREKAIWDVESFNASYSRITEQEEQLYHEKKQKADQEHDAALAEAAKNFRQNQEEENQRTKDNMTHLYAAARQSILDLKPEALREMYGMLQRNIPSVDNFEAAKEMPLAVEMGYLVVDFAQWKTNRDVEPVLELIYEQFSFAIRSLDGRKALMLPHGRCFEHSNFNKWIMYDAAGRQQALEYVRAMEMRMFMCIPCGKLRVTMIDPVDLGSNFSMFSCLGDDDERIISTKIWSDPKRIKEQLNLLIGQIEHVNQDCLRNEYENIVVYNEHVGKNAEPLQILFVADFPRHFDQESCEMLEKIASSGPKCGIYTVIVGADADIQESKFNMSGILQSMEQMRFTGDLFTYRFGNMTHVVDPMALPSKEAQAQILDVLKNGIKTSDRIIINFDEITDGLTRHPEKWFAFSDENGVDIPIGLEGASRTVQIHLGGELITQHHALISGTIGSGKSTLLHTIIMSVLMRYSPEDVQIYLLDFKRGVEFKLYAESKLPNFRVISLDTEPEFGLAVLRHLEQEQAARAQEFHDKNCDNIERYNEIAESALDDEVYKLPRIMVIIDEFHEMFSDLESAVGKECAMLLEQIVRQGRALGIHVILASQTLPENLVRIYGQIMNRVALQSTAASAQYILDSDNEAVNTLVNVDPGKGVFNDGGGNRDANHPFRVAYFSDEEQMDLLGRIAKRQAETLGDFEVEKPRLLLSSIQDDADNPLNQFVKDGSVPRVRDWGCPLYLGEEIAMVNEFQIRLSARRGQNLLILGTDHKRASQLYGFSAMSILFHAFRNSMEQRLPDAPIITYFDFGKSSTLTGRLTKGSMDIMNELSAEFPYAIRVFGKNSLMDGIAMLQKECEEKTFSETNHYVIFAGLNRAKRLLDTDGGYSMAPKQIFANLLKNGPEAGINFIVWANEPSSFCSFYAELLPEFDYRLVYNLKEEEYEQVIMSTEMSTSYGHNNVISYNPDEDNKKVRVYSTPLQGWVTQFMKRLQGVSGVYEETFDEFAEEGEFADDF